MGKRFAILIGVAAAGVMAIGGLTAWATSASAATGGSWELYPGQQTTQSTQVLPPVNADGSSVWPAKRGVIPVQFRLFESTGPTVFASYQSGEPQYSFASFTPSPALAQLSDLTNLSAIYDFTTGDCHGGALRWTVRIDTQDNGPGDDPAVYIYYGSPPAFDSCDAANGQSGQNLLAAPSVLRFDTSQLGGTFYDTWTDALTLAGNHDVTRASLVLDGGYLGDQVVDLTAATVNDNTLTMPSSQPAHRVCDLPPARLKWSIDDLSPSSGAVNEARSIQRKDTGAYFRRVDCKYIYNLDVRSLSGPGTYRVYPEINGSLVEPPAKFALR